MRPALLATALLWIAIGVVAFALAGCGSRYSNESYGQLARGVGQQIERPQ